MDDWQRLDSAVERVLRDAKAKQRRNAFEIVDGGKPAGNSDSLPPSGAERNREAEPARDIDCEGGGFTAKEN